MDERLSARVGDAVVETVEHVCNALCRVSEHVHCDLIWSDEASIDSLRDWLVSAYGPTFVALEYAREAPPLSQQLAMQPEHLVCLLTHEQDGHVDLPVADFTHAYLFFFRGWLESA